MTQLFISNLDGNYATNKIKQKLKELLANECKIEDDDIELTYKRQRCYAYIETKSERTQENIRRRFNNLGGLDFVLEGRNLHVAKRFMPGSESRQTQSINYGTTNGTTNEPIGAVEISASQSSPVISTMPQQLKTGYPASAFSGSRIYWRGTLLSRSEDRITEYKIGGGNYLQKRFIQHARKYVCAFLNGKGGKLVIGVSDDCVVHGIQCNRKQEDTIRLKIDQMIKSFRPTVFPECYDVQFPNVCDTIKDSSGKLLGHLTALKVIELSIYTSTRVQSADILYEDDRGSVYIRRDGSVQGPLRASEIIEWCRLRYGNNSYGRIHDYVMEHWTEDSTTKNSPACTLL